MKKHIEFYNMFTSKYGPSFFLTPGIEYSIENYANKKKHRLTFVWLFFCLEVKLNFTN